MVASSSAAGQPGLLRHGGVPDQHLVTAWSAGSRLECWEQVEWCAWCRRHLQLQWGTDGQPPGVVVLSDSHGTSQSIWRSSRQHYTSVHMQTHHTSSAASCPLSYLIAYHTVTPPIL